MKRLIAILVILFYALTLKAQLFQKKEFYPGLKKIIGKYYNGSGGRGWWSLQKMDSLGRVIEYNSYRKRKLMGKTFYQYNKNNDILYKVSAFDINRPDVVDSSKYQYKYANGRIVFQKQIFANGDFNLFKLIKQQDSVFTYQNISCNYRPYKKQYHISERRVILTYNKNKLIDKEEVSTDSSKTTTYRAYYSNRQLKHRLIEHAPEEKIKGVYLGSPGSDDEYYKYKYDGKGRVKIFYRIIGNKKYKIVDYQYIR